MHHTIIAMICLNLSQFVSRHMMDFTVPPGLAGSLVPSSVTDLLEVI